MQICSRKVLRKSCELFAPTLCNSLSLSCSCVRFIHVFSSLAKARHFLFRRSCPIPCNKAQSGLDPSRVPLLAFSSFLSALMYPDKSIADQMRILFFTKAESKSLRHRDVQHLNLGYKYRIFYKDSRHHSKMEMKYREKNPSISNAFHPERNWSEIALLEFAHNASW